jgi:uncharacterized protein (TIGR00730 family)
MKICIFGASSRNLDESYKRMTYDLSSELARRGHSLVFGAGNDGLMGAAARGFKDNGGKILGVIPHFFKNKTLEVIYRECDELIFTDTMAERKKIMEDNADAFIIVPGGVGTLEEFFEVLTLKQLHRHEKAIAIYNINGYYDSLDSAIRGYVDLKFIKENCLNLYKVINTQDEVIDYVENYSADGIKWDTLKK